MAFSRVALHDNCAILQEQSDNQVFGFGRRHRTCWYCLTSTFQPCGSACGTMFQTNFRGEFSVPCDSWQDFEGYMHTARAFHSIQSDNMTNSDSWYAANLDLLFLHFGVDWPLVILVPALA